MDRVIIYFIVFLLLAVFSTLTCFTNIGKAYIGQVNNEISQQPPQRLRYYQGLYEDRESGARSSLDSSGNATSRRWDFPKDSLHVKILQSMQQLSSGSTSDSALASGGFFDDISDRDWHLKMAIHCHESKSELQEARVITNKEAKAFYQDEDWKNIIAANYEPTFTCPFEQKLGSRVDGGKWICDPHRIALRGGCLVYSIGSNNQFDFEESILNQVSRSCLIHTFDPTVDGSTKPKVKNMHFHRLGLCSPAAQSADYYPIGEIFKLLSHANTTLDILKIDCEACEFDVFTDDFFSAAKERNVTIRQILVEIHPTMMHAANQTMHHQIHEYRRLFETLFREGYVIYHKEVNTIAYNIGQFVEYAFVLVEGTRKIDCRNFTSDLPPSER